MNGLFVGLTTLDFIYLADHFPSQNEKIVAREQMITAGGPATNAAVTFSYLGNCATLLSVIGSHPISQLILSDLSNYAVRVIDLASYRQESPPVSSIIVTQATGERAVISLNASKYQASSEQLPADILAAIDIILLDGHQMSISQAIAKQAKAKKIPIVIDGGSWKPGFEQLLPLADYTICSANFYPPHCQTTQEVFTYLQNLKIPAIAITQGEKPIQYFQQGMSGQLAVTAVPVVDTLGAGDIFHGAFCHFILENTFVDALSQASQIAANSCQYFGTRQLNSEL